MHHQITDQLDTPPPIPSAALFVEPMNDLPVDLLDAVVAAWEAGDLEPRTAIRAIVPELRTAEDRLEQATARVDAIKSLLRSIYSASGERVIAMPDLDLEIQARAPYVKQTVDAKATRAVIQRLLDLAEAHPTLREVAVQLEDAIKTTPVPGVVTVGKPRR